MAETNDNEKMRYEGEQRADLVARLQGAQAFGNFLLKAFNAFRTYGVDFMTLPEWTEGSQELEDARKLKPVAASWKIVNYIVRLDNALKAAIRRKQFRLQNGGRVSLTDKEPVA